MTTMTRDKARIPAWIADQGNADILGVDNPPGITKPTKLPTKGRTRITPKRPKIS